MGNVHMKALVTITRMWVTTTALCICVSCAPAEIEFASAEITMFRLPGTVENIADGARRVGDGDDLARLVACFGKAGRGKVGPLDPSLWRADAQVVLKQPNGTTVRITINWGDGLWSEGKGDWPLRNGCAKIVRDIWANAVAAK